jgi:hypothetical protein
MQIILLTHMFPEAAPAASFSSCRWTLANGVRTGDTTALAWRCAS